MEKGKERIEKIRSHLEAAPASSAAGVTPPTAPKVDAAALSVLLNGPSTLYKQELFNFLRNNPLFKLDYNQSKEAQRHIARARVMLLASKGFLKADPLPEERERFHQYSEALSYHDSSVNTLIGAQLTLFTGSILKMGTEHHLQNYAQKAESCELRGCFCLTELGHGSNVRGIETTAVYDKNREEFVINTPTETAQKYWIGGGVEWAQISTVFAQLYVDGVHHGVHAFIVPLRDENGKLLPGIRVKDCGHKMGLNGMDNARIWFDHVRIPRLNLLDKYGSVSKDGEYTTMIPNNDTRFAVTMGNLLTGRIGISRGSTNICKIALTTAIRYGFTRRQFGPVGNETPIIDYVIHQVRLMPLLATTFAHHFISKKATNDFLQAQDAMDIDAIKEVHVLVSGLKALTTWHLAETLQVCREACGGQGYKSSNRIGILKGDGDIQLTYEGDNFVLLQQVSKDLIKGELPKAQSQKNDLELKNRACKGFLLDPKAQLDVFLLREADLVARLKEEYGKAKAQGLSSEEALQLCATAAIEAGRAHIEMRVFKYFIEIESNLKENKEPISLVRSLYALTRFDSSPSFLREQYFSAEKQRAIHEMFVRLCGQVKQISLQLLDGFQIPEFLLGDIAGDWVAKNSFSSEDSI